MALLSLSALPAFADEAIDQVITDFITVCPAAILSPEQMPELGRSLGLTRQMSLPIGETFRQTSYQTEDGARTVSIMEHHFSDATLVSCGVAIFAEVDLAVLGRVQGELEAIPGIGPFEGRIIPMTGSIRSGLLKAAGTDPVITATFNTTATTASFALTTWQIDAAAVSELLVASRHTVYV